MTYDRICEYCGVSFSTKKPEKKYCCIKCRTGKDRDKRRAGVRGRTTANTGALSELLAAADLIVRGYDVFRSVCPSATFDLAVYKDGRFLRIECKTGRTYANGKRYHPVVANMHWDVLAIIYVDTVEITYHAPDMTEFIL